MSWCSGSDAVLHGNPDIDRVITMAERPSIGETLALIRGLFRRYDLVVCTQVGDRPTLFCLARGTPPGGPSSASRDDGRPLETPRHHVAITPDPETHE